MFFALSKIIGFFVVPSNFIALLGVAGLGLLVARRRRIGLGLLIASIVLLVVAGFSPLGNALLLALTERFPPWQQGTGGDPDGIIVLGGAIDSESSAARHSIELDASAERVLAMLRLARRYPSARIVYSGGSGNLLLASVSEAPFAGQLLDEFAVARDRIILEPHSRSTAENASFVRAMLTPKPNERWLLVTSAFHMPRAIGAFRRVGFNVEAYPVDWRTRGWTDISLPFDQLSSGLARTDVAIHEWGGLVVYWLAGKSSELFPSPAGGAAGGG
jgi:uncharacterized SAM-binding protein YcdF (DUF218 family)